MTTPTYQHRTVASAGTLTVVPAQVAAPPALAYPVAGAPSRPSWAWLMAADAVAALFVFLVASNLLPSLAPSRSSLGTNLAFVGISWALLALALAAKRVYRRARLHISPRPADELVLLEAAVVLGALATLALAAVVPALARGPLQPPAVAAAFGGCAVALPLTRALVIGLRGRSATRPARIVVVGTGTIASDVASRLARSPHVELIGFVDDDPLPGVPVLGDLASLPSVCRFAMVDRVVVAFSRSHPARTTDILRSLVGSVAVDIVPRYFELTGWQAHLQDLDGLAVISLDGAGPGPFGRFVKRAFDLVVASLGLLVAAPALGLAMLAIKVSSPGPVLFRQHRLGKDRRHFEILKLRTMREPAAADREQSERRIPRPLSHLPDVESRVTPVGRVLRRIGIDELPQLWNVLRGEMSIVGPRPFVPEECTVLPEWVSRRFEIRPGMTGLWQVCGQHDLRFEELCRLDCQYVAGWSFSSDVRIIARTPGRLLRGGGGGDQGAEGGRMAAPAPR